MDLPLMCAYCALIAEQIRVGMIPASHYGSAIPAEAVTMISGTLLCVIHAAEVIGGRMTLPR